MLAAHHDQENLVHSHHTVGARPGARQLLPKTPGTRYPKTPLKVPLNDENAPHVTGGKALAGQSKAKSVMGTGKRPALATPMGTQHRAPLGNKTTNAKARPGNTVGVKDMVREIEKSQVKQTTVQKPKLKPVSVAPIKFDVRNDNQETNEPEIEYAPPKPKALPYDSDILPRGSLTFEGLKKENLLRGYYERYHDQVDEDGVRLKDKEFEERKEKALQEGDERILRDIENTDWSVADVPETKTMKKKPATEAPREASKAVRSLKHPPTIASRHAASALSMASGLKDRNARAPLAPKCQNRKPISLLSGLKKSAKPLEQSKTGVQSALGETASRSTIGYTKGRSASSIVKSRAPLSRTASGASVASDDSDSTITPANAHLKLEPANGGIDSWPRPQFLNIFDINEDSDDEGFDASVDAGAEEEEFELKLGD